MRGNNSKNNNSSSSSSKSRSGAGLAKSLTPMQVKAKSVVARLEQLAVELDYTLRYNFLQDSIISRGHHILGLTLWMSMEALDVGVLK